MNPQDASANPIRHPKGVGRLVRPERDETSLRLILHPTIHRVVVPRRLDVLPSAGHRFFARQAARQQVKRLPDEIRVSGKNMRFLQRIKCDLSVPIWCLAGLYLSYVLFYASHEPPEKTAADTIYTFGSSFIVSWWLWHDARMNRFALPMSYGFLVLFALPIYAPIYIFHTRGWMGLVTIVLYSLIFSVISILYYFIFYLLHR